MSPDRERQAIAQVPCPQCGVPVGEPCYWQGDRPVIHPERRAAWRTLRDASEPDITMQSHARGPIGQREEWVELTPVSDSGRVELPRGPERVTHQQITARLADLRSRGVIVR